MSGLFYSRKQRNGKACKFNNSVCRNHFNHKSQNGLLWKMFIILNACQFFQKQLRLLKMLVYGITTKVLDASYCGVPQARKRFFFMIGHISDEDGFFG